MLFHGPYKTHQYDTWCSSRDRHCVTYSDLAWPPAVRGIILEMLLHQDQKWKIEFSVSESNILTKLRISFTLKYISLKAWCIIALYKKVLFLSVLEENIVCDHSYESYWVVLSCGIVYYAVQGGSNLKV